MAEKGEAIRLQRSRLREEQEVVREEGTSAAAFVNIALAERLGALRTARFVAERAARADLPAVIELPRRLGAGDPPLSGDEIDAPQGEAPPGPCQPLGGRPQG